MHEEVDAQHGQGGEEDESEHCIGYKSAAEEEVEESSDGIGQSSGSAVNCQGLHVGVSVGVKGHSAGEEGCDDVGVGHQGQGGGEADVFGR